MSHHDPATLRAARLGDCRGLTVLLAHSYAENNFLVVGDADPIAIYLDGDWTWHAFPVAEAGDRSGLAIGDVRIEVEVKSRFDARAEHHRGAIVRRGGGQFILITRGDRQGFRETVSHEIATGLDDSPGVAIGFRQWRVVKGEGAAAQVVLEFDVSGKADGDEDEA